MLENKRKRNALLQYLMMGEDFKLRTYSERREIFLDLVQNSGSLYGAIKRFYEKWYEGMDKHLDAGKIVTSWYDAVYVVQEKTAETVWKKIEAFIDLKRAREFIEHLPSSGGTKYRIVQVKWNEYRDG